MQNEYEHHEFDVGLILQYGGLPETKTQERPISEEKLKKFGKMVADYFENTYRRSNYLERIIP